MQGCLLTIDGEARGFLRIGGILQVAVSHKTPPCSFLGDYEYFAGSFL